MAISLPATRLAMDPARWARGRFIHSGDAGADQVYGMRGLVNQANHGIAYRVQTIASGIAHDDDQIFEGDTAEAWVDAFGPAAPEWGANVVVITAKIEFLSVAGGGDEVEVRLAAHDGTAWR